MYNWKLYICSHPCGLYKLDVWSQQGKASPIQTRLWQSLA